jgi:hypothetical protein
MTDPGEKFVEEIAGKLPLQAAYNDLLSPGAAEAGRAIENIVKTLHLALFPIQFLGAFQDRLSNFIDNSVRRVPEEKRVAPAPQILGPIIEGIRYEPEGTPIDTMFSELLSRSMDRDRVNEAHPSYPLIIKQLSSDEAKILASLDRNAFDYVYNGKGVFDHGNVEVGALLREELDFPDNVPLYFEHLHHLGLAGIFGAENQEVLSGDTPRVQTGVRRCCHYRLTDFGQRFVKACIGDGRSSDKADGGA